LTERVDIAAALKSGQAAMQAGGFDRALGVLGPVLEAEPDHADALYMKAASLR
jgi:hypothetical protein